MKKNVVQSHECMNSISDDNSIYLVITLGKNTTILYQFHIKMAQIVTI
jgi:hypothetical protein